MKQSKIAERIRAAGRGGPHRTGQPSVMSLGNGNGNGGCGPAMPTTPMSWGAGCPTGNCSAQDLANALNRSFAGERYPCREIPYWLAGVGDGNDQVVFTQNSAVTICPTRVIVALDDSSLTLNTMTLDSFEIGNQNQVVGDPIPILLLAPDSYAIIPFVTDCLRAGMPFSMTFSGVTEGVNLYVALIGPAIG